MKALIHMFLAFAASAAWAAPPNTDCPLAVVYPDLDAAYHSCNKGYVNGSCQRFIAAFRKVTARYDCQRSFDTGPVPAIWLSPTGAAEDFTQLLWRLSSEKKFDDKLYGDVRAEARALFASKEFQGTLDGDLAEEYLEKSEAISEELKQGRR